MIGVGKDEESGFANKLIFARRWLHSIIGELLFMIRQEFF